MKRRLFIIILLLAAVGGGIYYVMSEPRGQLVLTGIVTTDDVIVSSQVQGRLQELKVNQGDVVKRGDLLAIIQPEEQQADMAFYQQGEEQAQMQVSMAEAQLRFEEAQTTSQINQAQANLAAAEAQVAQGEADLENATLTFKHEEEAWKQGAEGQQTYDQARTGFDMQKARLETFRKQRDAAKAAVSVAQSNLEQVSERRSALEMNKRQLAAAAAQKDKAKVQLGYTEIRAPVDGIVDVRAAMQGEVVNPAQAIVTLINPDDLWVRADVEETYIDSVHIGDKFPVRLPSGAVREGEVFFRGVDADYATQRDVSQTKRDIKTFEFRLRCDNKDRSLAVGMTAYVTLHLQKASTTSPPTTFR